MTLARFGRKVMAILFPPSRWHRCTVPRPAERVAQRELRLGQHKAEKVLREASNAQQRDQYTASSARLVVTPRLPR